MAVVLSDDFTGTTIDSGKWATSVNVNGSVTQNDALLMAVTGGGGGDSAAQAIALTADLDDAEVLFDWSFSGSVGLNAWRAFLRASGDWAARGYPTTGYFVESASGAATPITLKRRDSDGTITTLASVEANFDRSLTYRTRFRIEGTALKAKVWLASDPEPGTWTLETTDAIYSAGKLQFAHQRSGNNLTWSLDNVSLEELGGADPPGSGSGSGTLSYVGAASGSSSRHGTASGTITYTGAATGSSERHGTASGTLAYAGVAEGSSSRHGTGSGSLSYEGAAQGSSDRHGSGTGTLAYTGTASGTAPTGDTLTTRFPGTSLPEGWTEYDPTGHGTVAVANGVQLTHGAISRNSIFSTGSDDQSIGIQHALDGGDLDVAVRVDGTDSGDWGDVLNHSVNLLIFGATTASAVRFSLYNNNADAEGIHVYGYTRHGGSGAQVVNAAYNRHFGGVPNWLRVKYTAATGVWRFETSADGVTWTSGREYDPPRTAIEATRQFEPATLVIGVSNSSGITTPVYVGRVVNMLTHGSEDVRDEVPERFPDTVSAVSGSDGSLPPDWEVVTLGSEFSSTWTGTALRLQAANPTESPNLSGRTVALRYTGESLWDWRLYVACQNPTPNASYFLTLTMAGDLAGEEDLTAAGLLDQYTAGGGYGLEVQSGTIRRPIRIDDDSDRSTSQAPPHSTGLNETPYCHLVNTTGPDLASGTHHFILERVGGRYRVKEWTGAREDEPAEGWYYDGDDFMNDVPMRPFISFSYNNDGGDAAVDLLDVELAELVASEPPGSGSGSGTLSYTGTASGHRDPAGTGTGAVEFTGTAVGSSERHGAGEGELVYVGAATGHAPSLDVPSGSGTGQLVYAGSAAGHRDPAGSGTGTLAYAGAATGHSTRHGSGVGTLHYEGVATVPERRTIFTGTTTLVTDPVGGTVLLEDPGGATKWRS